MSSRISTVVAKSYNDDEYELNIRMKENVNEEK